MSVARFSIGFNPRAPRGARRFVFRPLTAEQMFQSTRPARGATKPRGNVYVRVQRFNPRAPRGARRAADVAAAVAIAGFNPRAPRGARPVDHAASARCRAHDVGTFQSTRPARGATRGPAEPPAFSESFNPRAPRGARRRCGCAISARAQFQSTRPARGATEEAFPVRLHIEVSIHAPRAGRDASMLNDARKTDGFNPRAPRGARRAEDVAKFACVMFQSTRPARGATRHVRWRR